MSERAFEIEQATTGMDIMPTQLYVCNACCCGVERKGNMAVPLEELKQAWAEHGLAPEVKLTVSSCLGPCSMANVCMFSNESGRTWIGNLSTQEHYDVLVEWAQQVAQKGPDHPLPSMLDALRFTPA